MGTPVVQFSVDDELSVVNALTLPDEGVGIPKGNLEVTTQPLEPRRGTIR